MSAGQKVLWPNGGLTPPVNYRQASSGFRWTSPFGWRTHPVTGQPSTFHYGLDMIGWSTIVAPVTGTVTFAGYNGAAGNEVRIREDGTGDVFRLLHNRVLHVRSGQRVSQGQAVAIMGTTGSSTGVHCHEETRPKGGAAIDPLVYYSNRNASAAGGGGTPIEEIEMPPAFKEFQFTQGVALRTKEEAIADGRGRPGGWWRLWGGKDAAWINLAAGTGGLGSYLYVLHFYGSGLPVGETIDVRLVYVDPKTGAESPHYVGQIVGTKDGEFTQHITFARPIDKSTIVYCDAISSKSGAKFSLWGATVYNWQKR